jgi:hypothetical protein
MIETTISTVSTKTVTVYSVHCYDLVVIEEGGTFRVNLGSDGGGIQLSDVLRVDVAELPLGCDVTVLLPFGEIQFRNATKREILPSSPGN